MQNLKEGYMKLGFVFVAGLFGIILLCGCCGMVEGGTENLPQPAGQAQPEIEPPQTAAGQQPAGQGGSFEISIYDTEDPVDAGAETRYVIELVNGNSAFGETEVSLMLPANMEFKSASGDYSFELGKVVWRLERMEAEEIFTFTVQAKALTAGVADVKASASSGAYSREAEEGTSIYS
jgi:hypothetical protein